MMHILLGLIIVSSICLADNFKILSGNESFYLSSKDLQTKGEMNLSSPLNPFFGFQYNRNTSKNRRFIINYGLKNLNFNDNFDKKSILLNQLSLGQGFFINKTQSYYLAGFSERFFIFSNSSNLKIETAYMPFISIGTNHPFYMIDKKNVFNIGGNIIHYQSLNQSLNSYLIKNGTSFNGNISLTSFYNKFYYKLIFELGADSQKTEVSSTVLYKGSFFVDLNFKF